jgi:transposase-like protein
LKHCARCRSKDLIKNGYVKDTQRWKCKSCGFSFTRSKPKGAPQHLKEYAVLLWKKGLSQLAIAEIVGYSNVSVGKWIDQLEEELSAPETVDVVELDELHHFVGKKTKNAGCGLLSMVFQENCWTTHTVVVVPKRFALCLSD